MIRVLIQTVRGSTERRVYNERTLEYRETRGGFPPFPYPYGFIIGTRGADGDSVDCYLITQLQAEAGSIVECEPLGLLEQIEDGEIDHKVLASVPGERGELYREIRDTIQNFIHSLFVKYPNVNIQIGEILPREDALRHIEENREA